MTAFVFDVTTANNEEAFSTALGASSAAPFNINDLGKAVKLGTSQNYVPCATGDEIEGFVVAVEPFTVNNGFSFGSVIPEGRMHAQVSAGTVAIGGYVVSGVPLALGTAGLAQVIAGAPTKRLWRVIRNVTSPGNTAAVGHEVVIEFT